MCHWETHALISPWTKVHFHFSNAHTLPIHIQTQPSKTQTFPFRQCNIPVSHLNRTVVLWVFFVTVDVQTCSCPCKPHMPVMASTSEAAFIYTDGTDYNYSLCGPYDALRVDWITATWCITLPSSVATRPGSICHRC